MEMTKAKFAMMAPSELRERLASRRGSEEAKPEEKTEDYNTTVSTFKSHAK
jgi:hypothetical protein